MNYFKIGEETLKLVLAIIAAAKHPDHNVPFISSLLKELNELEDIGK